MKNVIEASEVENLIIKIKNTEVLLDTDIAKLYGVHTRRINEAVKNNPEKFPKSYILQLSKADKNELVENFDQFKNLKHSTAAPKAFTEKGLYMLATILKSPKATETTLSIIEAFTKVRKLANTIKELPEIKENATEHKALVKQANELLSDLIAPLRHAMCWHKRLSVRYSRCGHCHV